MKARLFTTLSLLVIVSMAANAQEIQSLFGRARTTGGYGAISNKFTTIGGEYANLCEVYGGVFLNRRWMLGLSFAGTTNNISVPLEYSVSPLKPMSYQYAQSGVIIERVLASNSTVHVVLNLFSGAGFTMQYDRNSIYDYNYQPDFYNTPHDENWFYVVEPGAQVEINLFRWMRLSPGISYRKTYGSDGLGLGDSELSNWSYNVTLKFGGFGRRSTPENP
jgi:hypothetical protein